ncbi:hypothetical protein ACJX0J_027130 [Zea mays]
MNTLLVAWRRISSIGSSLSKGRMSLLVYVYIYFIPAHEGVEVVDISSCMMVKRCYLINGDLRQPLHVKLHHAVISFSGIIDSVPYRLISFTLIFHIFPHVLEKNIDVVSNILIAFITRKPLPISHETSDKREYTEYPSFCTD